MSHFTPAGLPSASLRPSPINMIKVGFCDSSYLLAPSTSRTVPGAAKAGAMGLGEPVVRAHCCSQAGPAPTAPTPPSPPASPG